MLAASLMRTEEEIERDKAEEAKRAEDKKREEAAAAEVKPKDKGAPPKGKTEKQKEEAKKEEDETALKERQALEQKKQADEEQKLKLITCVPKDPDGAACLHENLLLQKAEIVEIISKFLKMLMEHIAQSRAAYVKALKESNAKMVNAS
jgi:hypothetical protein